MIEYKMLNTCNALKIAIRDKGGDLKFDYRNVAAVSLDSRVLCMIDLSTQFYFAKLYNKNIEFQSEGRL